ncbi:C13 family peptidase [Arhodomonas sp. AD133]|uniref:C13 family peptidase n=1 Tax=Arhodomonas sp. AD133 TaxID=3415009 RepID=UPI003EB75569
MNAARTLLLGLCLAFTAPAVSAAVGERHLLVVSGLGGEPYYRDVFHRWSLTLLETIHGRYAMDDARSIYLSAHPELAPERVDGISRKAAVLTAIATLAERSSPGDRILIVLIGHGSAQGPEALFNLPGPDLSATDLADALAALADRRVAVIDTTPASAPFLTALSRENRVIVSATANAAEAQHTRFAAYFVEALANDAADTDKDKAISLLEAFRYAKRQVAQAYHSEQRLLTEHALLDDDGDGRGSPEPSPEGGDGGLARRFTLAQPATDGGDERVTVAQQALDVQAQRLVDLIGRLKRDKRVLPPERYRDRLESLLVALALNRRAYREVAAR